ncbi:MAG TPA: hypothetical protein VH436_36280 [Vicinamibacterales bacterium]
MRVAERETFAAAPKASVSDRITDGVRHAAHFSHQVRLMKSMARDAGEEGVYAAKRLMRRVQHGAERLQDFRDEAAYRVKREPLKALGLAATAGLALGLAAGWIAGTTARRLGCKG